jgi:cytochrome c
MTDRFNTIAGWVLFSGIIALGLSILSGMYFGGDKPHRPATMGYPIEGVVEAGAADEGPALATLLATGDAAAGENSFAKCISCHTIEQGGANGIGPNLWGVMGTPIGQHVPGFAYSSALASHGGSWTYEAMDDWLRSPRGFAPGTLMSFAGLGNAQERANVMLYMRANGGGPALPEPPVADAVEEAAIEAPGGPQIVPGPAAAGATAMPVPVDTTQTNPVGE